jgi:hypothetical protein
MGVTIVATPVNVGRFDGSEGRAPVSVPDVPPVMVGMGAVFVPVEPPVIETLDPVFVAAAEVFPVFVAAEVFPFVCVAVERFGRSVAAADCADVPIASSETARAVERSGVFRKSLMTTCYSITMQNDERRPWTNASEVSYNEARAQSLEGCFVCSAQRMIESR